MGKGKNHDRKAGNPGFGKQKLKSSSGEKSEFTMKRVKGESLSSPGQATSRSDHPAICLFAVIADIQVKTSTFPPRMPRAKRC